MTLAARLYVLGMRLMRDKEAFEGEERTLEKARERQRSGNRDEATAGRDRRRPRLSLRGRRVPRHGLAVRWSG
ncbi:MAG: hypothetical protein EON52_07850 [Actinomycetales bacterium]|nr:MAG: hypothetical protein EON52_07850 [Actinomycetales bacterium]